MSDSRADRAGRAAAGFPRRAARTLAAVSGAIAVSASCLSTVAIPPAAAQPVPAQDGRVGPPIRLTPAPSGPAPSEPAPSAPARPEAAPSGPIQLRPAPAPVPDRTDPLQASPPSVPMLEAPPANPPGIAVVPKPGSPIQVEPLGPVDPDGAGVGDALAADLWRGLPVDEALILLSGLPVATPSPAAKTLQRRLLLSPGAPQARLDAFPGAPSAPARRFGALRVEALAAMGDPRGAAELAARLPESLADETTARALADAQLLAGTLDCAKALETAKGFSGVYWDKLALFCRLRAGGQAGSELAGVELTLDLLRERAGEEDAFLQLAEAMAGGQPPRLRPIRDSGRKDFGPEYGALTVAALRAARAAAPPDALELTDPALLAGIALGAATDPAVRAAAAERGAAALFLDARQLAEAYRAVAPAGDEAARLKELAARDRSARTRALVHQAFAGAMDGGRRVELARLAVELVDPALLAGPLGNAAAALLDTVSPLPDAAALAPAAARLYYALGRPDAARRWHELALRGRNPAVAARLWPLSVIAGGAPPGGTALGLGAWLDDALSGGDPPARGRVAGQLALLQAVGVAVPEDAWLRATDAGAPPVGAMVPDPALWERMNAAAAAGRVGETVLAALRLLGETGPAAASPVVVARVAASLRAVGLDAEARAIAREAAAALAG